MTHEQISLKELQRAGYQTLAVEDTFCYEDLPIKGGVKIQAQLVLTNTGATVTGTFQALAEEPCDRCAEPFERTLAQSFQDRYVYQSLATVSGGEHELHESDFWEMLGPDMILDLADLIHQHLVLALSVDRICERDSCITSAHTTIS